jgi:hypothetical protein
LADPDMKQKVLAQKGLYGERLFELFRKGNEHADELAKMSLQIEARKAAVFVGDVPEFAVTWDGESAVQGRVPSQLREYQMHDRVKEWHEKDSFKEMCPDPDDVDWPLSNELGNKANYKHEAMMNTLIRARADRLGDKEMRYHVHREIEAQWKTIEEQKMAAARGKEQEGSSTVLTAVAAPRPLSAAAEKSRMSWVKAREDLMAGPKPRKPRAKKAKVTIGGTPVPNVTSPAAASLAEEGAGAIVPVIREVVLRKRADVKVNKFVVKTMLNPTTRNGFQQMYADPYCEKCKENGIQIVEDREHILVKCPEIQPRIQLLQRRIFEMVSLSPGQEVTVIPNWFASRDTAECGNASFETMGLGLMPRIGGMCGLMPKAISDWLKETGREQLAKKINKTIIQETYAIQSAREKYMNKLARDKGVTAWKDAKRQRHLEKQRLQVQKRKQKEQQQQQKLLESQERQARMLQTPSSKKKRKRKDDVQHSPAKN